MGDITDFKSFQDRKKRIEEQDALDDIKDRTKLIYKDVNGWWQIIIEGESIPVSQIEEMPDHILERILHDDT